MSRQTEEMTIAFLSVFVCLLGIMTPTAAQNFGSFEGDVVTVWLPDGRKMRLTTDFGYRDPAGKRWLALKDSVVDGASIPRIFWTPVGGPFEGQYRSASVVHDVACVEQKETWQAVHRMFYYAMRAGGVGEYRAGVMYAAVYKFGPRWQEPKGFWARLGGGLKRIFGDSELMSELPSKPSAPPMPITEADVKALEALIEQNKPTTPEEVERLFKR